MLGKFGSLDFIWFKRNLSKLILIFVPLIELCVFLYTCICLYSTLLLTNEIISATFQFNLDDFSAFPSTLIHFYRCVFNIGFNQNMIYVVFVRYCLYIYFFNRLKCSRNWTRNLNPIEYPSCSPNWITHNVRIWFTI